MFFHKKNKTHVVLSGTFNSDADYGHICSELSKASGCKVWWEQDNNAVNIITDGNPNAVQACAIGMAMNLVADPLEKALESELRHDAIIRMN